MSSIALLKNELIDARRTVANFFEPLAAANAALEVEIQAVRDRYNVENAGLLNSANVAGKNLEAAENALRNALIEWYEEHGEKTFDKELSVRVSTKFIYEEQKAVEWAEKNAPIMIVHTIDKKAFESLPATKTLDFVEEKETVTAVVAKTLTAIEVVAA